MVSSSQLSCAMSQRSGKTRGRGAPVRLRGGGETKRCKSREQSSLTSPRPGVNGHCFRQPSVFQTPSKGSPACPSIAHCSPRGNALGTMKASCQPGRSAPGVGREDHEQQIEAFNPLALCPIGLIPAGSVPCNPMLPGGGLGAALPSQEACSRELWSYI